MLLDPGIFLGRAFRAPTGPVCPAWGVGSTVRTSSTFVSAAHETQFHLPHVLTPCYSSIRLQGMTLEDPPTNSSPATFPRADGSGLSSVGGGVTVRTSSTFVSAAHETQFHLPHVLTPRHSSIRLQGMTLEDPPHEVLARHFSARRRARSVQRGGWGRRSGRRRLLSVPRMRPNFTCRMFSLRVIVPSGCRV